MATVQNGGFAESFDTLDPNFWYSSDGFAIDGSWIDTAWDADNVTQAGGTVELELNTTDLAGKDFTGGEIQTHERYGYGTYTVTMQASGEEGVNSNFFTYTGPYFGDDWNEIDFEFLGKDPTKVWVTYHSGEGSYGGAWADLGFDASAGLHEYSFVWTPDSIRWYADGELLHEVVDPDLALPDTPGKIYMNIWAGSEDWLGTATFDGSTTAVYSEVSFTPWDGSTNEPPVSTDPDPTPEPEPEPEPQPEPEPEPEPHPEPEPEPEPSSSLIELFLVDADTRELIREIEDGDWIEASLLEGGSHTLLARLDDDAPFDAEARAFVFDLSGPVSHYERDKSEPFALFGGKGSRLDGTELPDGDYALDVTAFASPSFKGEALASETFEFHVGALGADADLLL